MRRRTRLKKREIWPSRWWYIPDVFDQCLFLVQQLVCDRNQVSVSRTETKVKFWCRSQKVFFRNQNFSFQNFSNLLMFFCFLGGYKFLKAWNWTQIFKNNLKISNIWQRVLFKGPFYGWKDTSTRFSLWNVVSVSAESIDKFGFQFQT